MNHISDQELQARIEAYETEAKRRRMIVGVSHGLFLVWMIFRLAQVFG